MLETVLSRNKHMALQTRLKEEKVITLAYGDAWDYLIALSIRKSKLNQEKKQKRNKKFYKITTMT